VFALVTRATTTAFGPADWVTMIRACLVGCVTALALDPDHHRSALVGIAIVALVLDAVDGQVARRTKTATPFGARFDMEVDAYLILVLSLYVAPSIGWWVLAIGAMRYVWVIFSRVRPWMRGSLPPRYWRKVVAAIQGIVLVTAASGLLPKPLVTIALLGALALLVESFGRDIVWLWYQRPVEPLRQRLRTALPAAMKAGDRAAVSALRSTLSAIDNAEAVERKASVDKHLAIELIPSGAGAAEVARRELTELDVEEIVRTEVAEREAAVRELETAGRPELADDLRAQIRVLATHLSR
jgi:phosphatidylglycerophosphate synthase